jgi:hypothetical protein
LLIDFLVSLNVSLNLGIVAGFETGGYNEGKLNTGGF